MLRIKDDWLADGQLYGRGLFGAVTSAGMDSLRATYCCQGTSQWIILSPVSGTPHQVRKTLPLSLGTKASFTLSAITLF